MRFTPLALSSLFILGAAGHAFAQETKGLNKHDASIAHYNYTVPIQVDESTSDAGSLKDDLDSGSSATDNKAPVMAKAPMLAPAALQNTIPVPEMGNVLNSSAANFTLPSVQGPNASLNESLAKGPTLLLFVNGMSTPHLQLMQKNLQQFGILGIQVLAVTSEPLNSLRAVQQQYNFSFPIVSDPGSMIARRYGLPAGVPALLSVSKQGKIVGVQMQPRNNLFNLTTATAPLRLPATQASIPAPAVMTDTPPQPSAMAVANDPVLDQPAEMLSDTNDAAPVMPAVPSPRSTKAMQVPDSVPKIKYAVPPSSPDFVSAGKTNTIEI